MKPLLASLLLAVACGCAQPSESLERATTVDAGGPTTTGASLYPIQVSLRDQDGAAIGLDVHRGHAVIVSMFYGSCPSACPLLVSHVKELEASLPPEVRAEVRVLLVSFDAEHDTPERLSAIARDHHIATDRWRLATGADDEVRQIASALDVAYRKQPDGSYTHNSVIAVLDGKGRVVARTEDTMPELAPLAAAVRRSVQR